MGLFSNFFSKKSAENVENVGGMEDFMTLISVYLQSNIAGNLGITNLNFLPELATFKRSLRIQTQNNKLGVAEKSRCKKMLQQMYGLTDDFFKEFDASIRKNCRNANQIQSYMIQFQGFSSDLMMQVGTMMKWKFRVPSFMKKALKSLTEDAVHKIETSNSWSDEASYKTVYNIRQLQQHLNLSEKWMNEFAYSMLVLAKKEPRNKEKMEAAKEALEKRGK